MTRLRNIAAIAAVSLALASCGGDDEESVQVGDCIDDSGGVVDCSSSEAQMEIVSDLDAPDAIACVTIVEPPQEEITVAGGEYCAVPLE
jgi:hypothetical protein